MISQQIADSQQIILDRFPFRILLQPLNCPRIIHSRTPAVKIHAPQLAAGIAVVTIAGGFLVALYHIGKIALYRLALPINISHNIPSPEVSGLCRFQRPREGRLVVILGVGQVFGIRFPELSVRTYCVGDVCGGLF